MNVHLVTAVGSHLDLLPHMLSHYKQAGMSSLLVNLHINSYEDPIYKEALEVCNDLGAVLYSVYLGPWLQHVNTFLLSQARQALPDDWFVLADLDEFQVYPQHIPTFLETIDRQGYDYVEGCVIDRISKDGSLPPVVANTSVWKQFPLAGLLTHSLTGGATQKIVAVKGKLPLTGGQHFAVGGHGCPRETAFIPVHHFKWTAGLSKRLSERVAFFKKHNQPFGEHSDRFLKYYIDHHGRIDTQDEAFQLAECEYDYPHFESLKLRLSGKLTELKKTRQHSAVG